MIQNEQQKMVDAAITSRRSIRAFLPTPVAREDVESILDVAARAPSGTNTQTWKVYVLTGGALGARLVRVLPAVSALAVIGLGIAMTVRALPSLT